MLKRLLRYMAFRRGKFEGAYVRFCRPSGEEYARYLKARGRLQSMGDDCYVMTSATILDPATVSLGNNVALSNCTLIGHDGSIIMLNKAYGKNLDAVGPIVIRDNVFVGHGAILMPNVSIGPNAIVAAGAVVTRDVPPDTVVGGVPARPIGTVSALVERMEAETQRLPWADLLAQRGPGKYDPALEAKMHAVRMAHFFPDGAPPPLANGSAANAGRPS